MKLLSLFKSRVEHGVSHLGRCGFMTITYQADNPEHRDASSVRADWQALWRNLKRKGYLWSWLKVTELTKQGVPHHHVVLGTITGEVRCHGTTIKKGAETIRYLSRLPACACLSHIFAREWWSITGDSYMCFATPVTDPLGAASYMAKYMAKAFLSDSLGQRRFATSRDWPGGTRMRLRTTLEGGWAYTRRWSLSRFSSTENLNEGLEDLLERIGDDITKKRALIRSKRAAETLFRKMLTR